jgi:hypothetical protein
MSWRHLRCIQKVLFKEQQQEIYEAREHYHSLLVARHKPRINPANLRLRHSQIQKISLQPPAPWALQPPAPWALPATKATAATKHHSNHSGPTIPLALDQELLLSRIAILAQKIWYRARTKQLVNGCMSGLHGACTIESMIIAWIKGSAYQVPCPRLQNNQTHYTNTWRLRRIISRPLTTYTTEKSFNSIYD